MSDRLAADLRPEFPGPKGFSSRNPKGTRTLAREWPERSFVQQLAAQMTWSHPRPLSPSRPAARPRCGRRRRPSSGLP
ncbi:MAG: DUF1016 N-terminal domain-containing protein [Planctomycetota bacterium]